MVLFFACSGGPGAVGVVQPVAGQAQEVVQLDAGFLGEQVPGVVGCWLSRRSMSRRSELMSTPVPPWGSAVIFGNRAMVLQMISASIQEVAGQGALVRAGGDPAE